MQLAPGVVERSVQGSSRNEMAYLVDGVTSTRRTRGTPRPISTGTRSSRWSSSRPATRPRTTAWSVAP
jgi:hypothetical protein